MKRYLKRLSLISCILVLIIISILAVKRQAILSHSWKVPSQVHILFMGASHIMNSIDDSMMQEAINWASSSERYMFTCIKLERLLEANPQIDTIYLELAATDIWEDTDYKYHVLNEQSHFVKYYWPFFNSEQWMLYKNEPMQVAGLIVSSIGSFKEFTQKGWWKKMGGYDGKDAVIDPDKKSVLPYVVPGSGHQINYDYLRRIIKLCKEKGVKLYFIETPVYHIEDIYDTAYFYNVYRQAFSDVEFLDYSNWPIPMDERADGSHLNKRGARRFTRFLMNQHRMK